MREPRPMKSGVRVAQGSRAGDESRARAQRRAGQRDSGRPEEIGPADSEQKIERVLDEDDADIGAVEETGAGERRAIVEEGAAKPRDRRQRDEAGRQPEVEIGERKDERAEPDQRRDASETDIEGRADRRRFEARARRIEPHRRQSQPVEARRVDEHGGRPGDGETAEFGRPEQFRDQQTDKEIDEGVRGESEPDDHRDESSSLAIGARAWTKRGLGVRD